MTTIKQITNYLNEVFPFAYQESYDNSGLLVGNPEAEVKGLLITLDVTEAVVDEAISTGCNVILSHHPIIFQGIKKLTGATFEERTIIKAVSNDIAIIASHTNTDNSVLGTNYHLAKLFGLQETKPLLPLQDTMRKLVTFVPFSFEQKVKNALFKSGAGVIGNYDSTSFTVQGTGSFRGNEFTHGFSGVAGKLHLEKEIRIETVFPKHMEQTIIRSLLEAHPYEEVAYDIYRVENSYGNFGSGIVGNLPNEMMADTFLEKIKTLIGGVIRYTHLHTKTIKRVSICGGTGIFLLGNAIRQKADIFITSDVKYHQFFGAGKKIIIADVGHYESEQFTKEIFFNLIQNFFPTFAPHLSKINTNPINYL